MNQQTQVKRSPDLAEIEIRVRKLVNLAVDFELKARNLDRPDAEKYGWLTPSQPRHAPEWYVAQGIGTHIHEALHGCFIDPSAS